MRRSKTLAALSVFLVIPVAWLWWIVAWDYGDSVTEGTYRFRRGDIDSTLVLKSDHTFDEQLTQAGKTVHAKGSWRRVGEGGVTFSKEFIQVPGEELASDGTSIADLQKSMGLFPSLRFRSYEVIWYGRPKPPNDEGLSVEYTGDEPEIEATLELNPDHSFEQEISRSGTAVQSKGTWAVGPNGAITFSKTFLKPSGQCLGPDESATAEDPSPSGFYITIRNVSSSNGPVFRKRLVNW